jgi:hypothetical protein
MTAEETYDKWGERLVDLVDGMAKDDMEAGMAVALLLDYSIDLTFYTAENETAARSAIDLMTDDVAKRFGNAENN